MNCARPARAAPPAWRQLPASRRLCLGQSRSKRCTGSRTCPGSCCSSLCARWLLSGRRKLHGTGVMGGEGRGGCLSSLPLACVGVRFVGGGAWAVRRTAGIAGRVRLQVLAFADVGQRSCRQRDNEPGERQQRECPKTPHGRASGRGQRVPTVARPTHAPLHRSAHGSAGAARGAASNGSPDAVFTRDRDSQYTKYRASVISECRIPRFGFRMRSISPY